MWYYRYINKDTGEIGVNNKGYNTKEDAKLACWNYLKHFHPKSSWKDITVSVQDHPYRENI